MIWLYTSRNKDHVLMCPYSCGIDNKNSVALMQDDTTCTEMITEAQAEADLNFAKEKLYAIFSPGYQIFTNQLKI